MIPRTNTCELSQAGSAADQRTNPHIQACNIYLGENFTVRLNQWFKFISLLHDADNGGIVFCDFDPNRHFSRMHLSNDAEKIRDVPNAGGSSVISEFLSFELLQKCFKARLLKVRFRIFFVILFSLFSKIKQNKPRCEKKTTCLRFFRSNKTQADVEFRIHITETKVTPDFRLTYSKNWGNPGSDQNDKMDNFQVFSIKSYVVVVYYNCLTEAILIHIQNI